MVGEKYRGVLHTGACGPEGEGNWDLAHLL